MHGCCRVALVVASCGGYLAGGAAAQSEPPPGAPPPAPAQVTRGDNITTADQLLDALQTADRDLVSLTADVKWDRTFEIQGDKQSRLGKLYYVVTKPQTPDGAPERRFAIRFDQLWVGGVQRPEDRTYIFDGQWFMEKDALQKFFQKRQVAPPGEHVDPLRIGQGPIAIPIGQRKQDIVERYTVELLPATAGLDAPPEADKSEKDAAAQLKAAVQGAWELHLVPKPQFADEEDFTDIRLWYRRGVDGSIMPRMARTTNKQGDVSNVLLINDQAQRAGRPENPEAKVPAEMMDTTPPTGWDGSTVDWRGRGGAESGGAGATGATH